MQECWKLFPVRIPILTHHCCQYGAALKTMSWNCQVKVVSANKLSSRLRCKLKPGYWFLLLLQLPFCLSIGRIFSVLSYVCLRIYILTLRAPLTFKIMLDLPGSADFSCSNLVAFDTLYVGPQPWTFHVNEMHLNPRGITYNIMKYT